MPYKDPIKAKESNRKKSKAYYWKNKDKVLSKTAEFRKNNPDHVRERDKKYRLERAEYYKEYNKKYREQNKEYFKKYYEDRPTYHRDYWKNNLDRMKDNSKKWREKNKEYLKIVSKLHKHKRRALGYLSLDMIQSLYEDNIRKYNTLTCVLCIKPIPFGDDTIEHLLPVSRGGTNDHHNLAIAHHICNITKKDKTVEEYKSYLERVGKKNVNV